MRRVLIAAGGTGGHIFPAIVFGKNLQEKCGHVEWMCGSRELERTIYNAEGISPLCLPLAGSPLGTKSPLKILGRIADVVKSVMFTLRHVKRFDAVYLFGGYISFAPLVAAKLRKIPVMLHEQNTVAGKVTRLASKWGVKILTGWPRCEGVSKFEYVGIPVREPVRIEREEALNLLGLNIPASAKIVGIAGGSLGSGPLSEILKRTAELCRDCEFVFLSSKVREDRDNMHFILSQWDMNPFYSVSDILVCRAGGSTLAEALKWGMPTITIPWPGAMDNHQAKNAEEFVKLAGNAQIFSETGSPEELAGIIMNMLDGGYAA
ncbi:MAG: UDP-N-acetylglucosamine--N-acetylmuramyl-(pentapeptide) pyrophosphoryl-undecaprenol N-acetylglucosamine transferase [Synergistaceae bacterium]|nr:UDP-N-acetylglucosamine--N-acetylmuramyl-(pentapeptide) pyrophosphoryl-undecaprenol N-acetylglucosamine transferase [Synergistaceae bacterium]